MAERSTDDEGGGLPEGLRTAIERTFAATTGSAAETRERAQEVLDEATRRGQDAREAVARRGQEAREASGSVATRVVEAIQDMRLATREDLRDLREELADLARRVTDLERESGAAAPPAKPEAKG